MGEASPNVKRLDRALKRKGRPVAGPPPDK